MEKNIITVPYIVGDGIGLDIWKASRMVFDKAIKHTYKGEKQIKWKEI